MEDYQQRALDECKDLTDKVTKLTAFVNAGHADKIQDPKERGCLLRQLPAMAAYLGELTDRIEIWRERGDLDD